MSRVEFSDDARMAIVFLQKSPLKGSQSIVRAIENKMMLLSQDLQYGDSIAKQKIPDYYKKRYGATNLFRVELPCFWRMIYSLTKREYNSETIVLIVDIIDHKEYDKKFGYKK
jgi:hypothetical protein